MISSLCVFDSYTAAKWRRRTLPDAEAHRPCRRYPSEQCDKIPVASCPPPVQDKAFVATQANTSKRLGTAVLPDTGPAISAYEDLPLRAEVR